MRIRIFRAFASNNSGSYTIVGSFESEDTAEEIAKELHAVCEAHHEWATKSVRSAQVAPSPLDAFVRAKGLTHDRAEGEDDWPMDGMPAPSLARVGKQVLLHVPTTVTMPRAFGEYFYQRGGRVQVEIDHAHEPLVAHFEFWMPDTKYGDPRRFETTEALRRDLEALLDAADAEPKHAARTKVKSIFRRDQWQTLSLLAVFSDVVKGTEVVQAAARQRGVFVRVRLREAEEGLADPLAALRGCAPR